MEVVRALADGIGSRPAGTEAERRAAAYLADEFTALGYTTETVSFHYSSGRFGSGTSQNVVATAPGEDPNLPLVVIGGHYDSVPAGPGANDNASGTGTTLAVARELMRAPVPGVVVRFVAFGAEEIGLFGSKDYVSKLSQADRARLQVAISIDMMSVGQQPAFGGSEPWLSEAMVRAASQGYEPRNLSGFLRQMSDHAPFLDAGLPGVMFHWVEDPYYHTALDVTANVQPAALDLMGAIAIELVRVAAGWYR
jgi:aminopeptidase S